MYVVCGLELRNALFGRDGVGEDEVSSINAENQEGTAASSPYLLSQYSIFNIQIASGSVTNVITTVSTIILQTIEALILYIPTVSQNMRSVTS